MALKSNTNQYSQSWSQSQIPLTRKKEFSAPNALKVLRLKQFWVSQKAQTKPKIH